MVVRGWVMALFTLNNVVCNNLIHYPDLTIMPQLVTFICGESGSGKSTLLKLLNGMISADRGVVTYQGKDIQAWDPVFLHRAVILGGQSPYLFDLSVKDNFLEFYHYRELQPVSEPEMSEYLRLCALECPLEASCGTMSGGEKQRVFLALCLSLKPEVLLLDEPTSALDAHNAAVVLSNIKDYCRTNQITLLVVSHSKELSETLADEVINL